MRIPPCDCNTQSPMLTHGKTSLARSGLDYPSSALGQSGRVDDDNLTPGRRPVARRGCHGTASALPCSGNKPMGSGSCTSKGTGRRGSSSVDDPQGAAQLKSTGGGRSPASLVETLIAKQQRDELLVPPGSVIYHPPSGRRHKRSLRCCLAAARGANCFQSLGQGQGGQVTQILRKPTA
ncbi:MAG: hypothetical protein M1840_008206 [Geoglossum simile]|nr:MAG: hypothetical protein M1840_008206 [Geoglossum simile]